MGTIATAAEALRAIEAGAKYLVTPLTDPSVIAAAVAHGVAIYPGGLTPTELFAGWSAGATAVKVFPASVVGPGYVSMLRGPFPDIEVVPSGGVGINDAAAWIRAGSLAVSLGGPLIGDAFHGRVWKQLTERAVRLRGLVDEAGGVRPHSAGTVSGDHWGDDGAPNSRAAGTASPRLDHGPWHRRLRIQRGHRGERSEETPYGAAGWAQTRWGNSF